MHPDDDLKAPFAELQRRRREQAPAFGPMRERALRRASEPPVRDRGNRMLARLALAGATCAAVMATWWAIQGPHSGTQESGTVAKDDVEMLITAIEQHLEVAAPAAEYPTDLLLAGDSATDPAR